MFKSRKSGVLLHISSLPGRHGIGDLGSCAYDFVDKLELMGQAFWQILPTNEPNGSNSPYDTNSAFAQNPLFISLDLLYADNLLDEKDIESANEIDEVKVDYDKLKKLKKPLITKAAKVFQIKNNHEMDLSFKTFCNENTFWLPQYAIYKVLKNKFNQSPWYEWGSEIRTYNESKIKNISKEYFEEIETIKIIQFLFYKQWLSLKTYANKKNISLIGDLPIYVSHDSVDVWTNQLLYKLNKNGGLTVKSGCPPDYFIETGQVWGHPIYNWENHAKDGFGWWIKRISFLSELVDMIRFDHFNGLLKYWEIPAENNTAIIGDWKRGPGKELIQKLYDNVQGIKIIAEDLGELSTEVAELRSFKNIPGMKVFQFDFDNICKEINENKVLFTGTHDNDTLVGWYKKELKKLFDNNSIRFQSDELKQIISRNSKLIHLDIVKYCMETKYPLVIIPLQDLIGLNGDCRMNEPGTLNKANWSWKSTTEDISDNLIETINTITYNSGRT